MTQEAAPQPALEALKPCPFCGGSATIDRYGDHRVSTQYSCDECSCSLETGEEWGHGKRWNTRYSAQQKVPDDIEWRLRVVAELQEKFVAARAAMNAARVDPSFGTSAERALYVESYNADHAAEQAMQSAALQLAHDLPAMLAAKPQPPEMGGLVERLRKLADRTDDQPFRQQSIRIAADAIERLERERGDLLQAAGFRRTADLHPVIMEDICGLRPAMVAARMKVQEHESDTDLLNCLLHDEPAFLLKVWKMKRHLSRQVHDLTAANATIRAETVAECAKVAEKITGTNTMDKTAKYIAERIRALSSGTAPQTGSES